MADEVLSAFFFAYTGVAAVLCALGVKFFIKRHLKAERIPFGLPATVALMVALENLFLAVAAASDDQAAVSSLNDTRFLLHAFVVPMMMICLFELAYLVHKRRSVNFMGIKFDAGHRSATNRRSLFVRHLVWVFSIGLAAFSFVSTLRVIRGDDSAGKTLRYTSERLDFTHEGSALQSVADLLPSILLIVFAIYIGLASWRYGTLYSFRVHATRWNPWIWLVLGAVTVLVGRLLPEGITLYTSNGGELVLLASLLLLLPEVHKDLKGQADFSEFLHVKGRARAADEEAAQTPATAAFAARAAALREGEGWTGDADARPGVGVGVGVGVGIDVNGESHTGEKVGGAIGEGGPDEEAGEAGAADTAAKVDRAAPGGEDEEAGVRGDEAEGRGGGPRGEGEAENEGTGEAEEEKASQRGGGVEEGEGEETGEEEGAQQREGGADEREEETGEVEGSGADSRDEDEDEGEGEGEGEETGEEEGAQQSEGRVDEREEEAGEEEGAQQSEGRVDEREEEAGEGEGEGEGEDSGADSRDEGEGENEGEDHSGGEQQGDAAGGDVGKSPGAREGEGGHEEAQGGATGPEPSPRGAVAPGDVAVDVGDASQ